ncbi:MAG: hypothetical protein IPH84_02265 [Bacteroidales bacterium]|nr:hypothetical protein [Bacteroidales bacterium]
MPEIVQEYFSTLYESKDHSFGNGRMVRNYFEKMIQVHSDRISLLPEVDEATLNTFAPEDAEKAMDRPLSGGGGKKAIGFKH